MAVAIRACSECGTALEPVVYGGDLECGPHTLSEFHEVPGYVLDVQDMYGDWDSPDWFVLPADKLGTVGGVWTTNEKCCYYREPPDYDDEDYCLACGDVMEPAPAEKEGTE